MCLRGHGGVRPEPFGRGLLWGQEAASRLSAPAPQCPPPRLQLWDLGPLLLTLGTHHFLNVTSQSNLSDI